MANQKGTVKAGIILQKLSPKSCRLDAISSVGRQAGGKQIVEMKSGDAVIGLVVPGAMPLEHAITNKKSKKRQEQQLPW